MEVFYEGHWRMDWGLGNPNKTAVLIAELMVASWIFAFWKPSSNLKRRTSNFSWGFWLSLVLSTAFGVCLVMTYSRGGLVAAFCGLGVLLAFAPRPWARTRVIAILVTIFVLGSFAFFAKATTRYGQGIAEDDPSISNRLEIWKKAPRMMVDAPTGWGWGRSGDAYMQWYQPLNRLERYRTLVNSHLTWMVEVGWFSRILYISAWIVVMSLCLQTRGRRWLAIPFSLWTVLGIGAFFSSVGECVWVWFLPAVALAGVLFFRIRDNFWPNHRTWVGATVLIALCVVGLYVAGIMTTTIYTIRGSSEVVSIRTKSEPPAKVLPLWMISPDKTIVGEKYGHAIRKALVNLGSRFIGVAASNESIPKDEPIQVVLMGKIPHPSPSAQSKMVLLNPIGSPSQWLIDTSSVKIIWGEYRRGDDRSKWEALPQSNAKISFEEARGAAEFISEWPALAFP